MHLAGRLRHATAEINQGLDRSLDLLRGDLTLDRDVDVLRALHGFVAPWESQVAATGWMDADELALWRAFRRELEALPEAAHDAAAAVS